jgi:hypothetical protein
MAGSRCKKCNRFIKAKYAYGTGLCYRCYQNNNRRGVHHITETPTSNQGGIKMPDITGKKDAEFMKHRYQNRINEAHGVVKSKIEFLYKMNHKLKGATADVDRLKKDIKADEEERAELFSSLQNLLTKETDFEAKMWDKTQKGRKVKSITVKQKFKDSDIDEMRYDSMMEYIKKYPEYTSKSSFSTILSKISETEGGIKKTKKTYHEAISRLKKELAYFPRNLMEAKNKVKTYKDILAEGKEKLGGMRYLKGILFKLSSERKKLNVSLDTLNHKMHEYEDTINRIEEEVKAAEKEVKEDGNI